MTVTDIQWTRSNCSNSSQAMNPAAGQAEAEPSILLMQCNMPEEEAATLVSRRREHVFISSEYLCLSTYPLDAIQYAIGLVYLISGFGGSLMSALFIQTNVSVGASGALFGLIGSMLSELITNWSLYANKVAALLTLALGLLPRVDNFAHIGGLVSGFLLGFVFFIRPTQQRRVSAATAEAPQPGGQPTTTAAAQLAVPVKRKHKTYQYVLLVVGFTVATVLLFRGYNANEHCPWCHYLSCVPTKRWRCDASPTTCTGTLQENTLTIVCAGGRNQTYVVASSADASQDRINDLCNQLCT